MSDSEKGTKENPYSYDEYKRLVDAGEWPGGYYRMETGPVAYAMPVTNVSSSSGYDGSGSDSGSDYYGSDELRSDTTNIETPGQPGDSTNTNPGRGGGGTGGINSGGGTPSGGGSGSSHSGGSDNYPTYADVLPTNKFSGFKKSEPTECFKRCKEMLANAGCELVGTLSSEILMANSDSLGNATTAASSFEEGLDYIDGQLAQGNPVIVGVDYGPGHTTGPDWKDKATNHFVIIVGGGRTSGYHFYDPGTAHPDQGTSTKNKFTINDGILMSTETHVGGAEYYKLVSIRKNK